MSDRTLDALRAAAGPVRRSAPAQAPTLLLAGATGPMGAAVLQRLGGSHRFAQVQVLAREAFDPYPYILLNLVLSCLAAIQAPIIMMSQNRQAEIDRREAEHDYAVNVKAELEIELLHAKIDALREQEIARLTAIIEKLSDQLAAERRG